MTAIEKLNEMAREFAKQKDIVVEEYNTIEKAHKLMKKWNETRFVDAVSQEAKSRAVAATK